MINSKLSNEYAIYIGADLFGGCPKTVFAAIAISALTVGGDHIADARSRVIAEWWALYDAGIVPQRPKFARLDTTTDQPFGA